jgi:TPR repeat protein
VEAQCILAWNDLNGRGVRRDTAATAPPFRTAAEAGNAGAQFQLAAMSCTGTGAARNLGEAVELYRCSAKKATATPRTISPSCY